ncbi:MAG: hypothetical protein R3Y04_04490 [Rikenellaceae bacterium]
MKKFFKIFFFTLLTLVILIFGSATFAVNTILTPEKVTPIINTALEELIDGNSSVYSVDVTFVSSFPDFRIKVDSLYIGDSLDHRLLSLESLVVDFQPLPYIMDKDVIVTNIEFVKPRMTLYTSEDGTSNLSIFKYYSDTTVVDTSQVDSTSRIRLKDYVRSIDVKNIAIDSCYFRSIDRTTNSRIIVEALSLQIGGKFSDSISNLTLSMNTGDMNYFVNKTNPMKNVSIGVEADIVFIRDSSLLLINDASVQFKEISLKADGSLRGNRRERNLTTDLHFNLAVNSLKNILEKLPAKYIEQGQEFSANGMVELDGTVQGVYDKRKGKYPALNALFTISDGNFKFDNMDYGVQKLDIAADVFIDGDSLDNSHLDVTKFDIVSDAGVDISSTLKVRDIFDKVVVGFELNADADISKIREILPITDAITIQGTNHTRIKGRLNQNMILNQNYGAIHLEGESTFTDLLLIVDGSLMADSLANDTYLYVEMSSGVITVGSAGRRSKNSSNEPNLAGEMNFTGFGFKNNQGIEAQLSNVAMNATTYLTKDTTQVIPITGEIVLDRLTAVMVDTLDSYIGSSKISFSTNPSSQDKTKPVTQLSIETQSIGVEAIPTKTDAYLDEATLALTLTPDSTLSAGYLMQGSLGFKGLEVASELLPLDVVMKNSRISFDNKRFELTGTRVTMGNSSIAVTGWIENLLGRAFEMNEDKLVCNLSLSSRNIDLTEIYLASLAASDSFSADTTQIRMELESNVQEAVQLFKVPEFIEAKMSVDLTKISFGPLDITNIKGSMDLNEGLMFLDKMDFRAAGSDMNITSLYNPVSDSLAYVSFDLDAKGIVLSELIRVVPSVDSLMPMLKSVEGDVDFVMVAQTELDRNMNIVLESLESVMHFDGQNLVLMDSETFAELSKKLMFKNKDKNLIDSLEMNVVVNKDGVIDVPPFKIIMDRYEAIIGGTQTVDYNTFDIQYSYNVSIIKSPLIFKAGVDIVGDANDFEFDITKAKLKNSDFVQIQSEVDSIGNSIRKNIVMDYPIIMQQKELRKERIRRDSMMQNSLPQIKSPTSEQAKPESLKGTEVGVTSN